MKKINSIVTLVFVCLFLTSLTVKGENATSIESEFAALIIKADSDFNSGDSRLAEENLFQANEILTANPNLNSTLQGHFNKVSGKLYMHTSLNTALAYFNTAFSQFSDKPSEQAQVKMFIGIAYLYANNLAAAEMYFNESNDYFSSHDDRESLAQSLNNLGVLRFQQGDTQTAVSLCSQAFAINTYAGNSAEASKNQENINRFLGGGFLAENNDDKAEPEIINHGGGGSSGSGTEISTSGSGTVVTGSGGGGGGGGT